LTVDFVAIDTGIAGDRLTIELARSFKLARSHAAGLLVLTFAGMAKHAADGDLGAVLDEQIEEWAYWTGKRGTYAAFVRRNLCDDTGLVTAWDRWNGKMIARAKADAARLREYREKKRLERIANADANGSRTRTETEPYNSGNAVPNQTKPNQTKPNTRTTFSGEPERAVVEKSTWITPSVVAWEAVYGPGSCDIGQATRELAPLYAKGKGLSPEVIGKRLAFYLRQKGIEGDPTREQVQRANFRPSLRDFRLRHGAFDPTLPAFGEAA
jgi:hypothetical protein